MSELYIVERLRLKRAEITALRTRLSSAEAERDRLREGLEPFAEFGDFLAEETEGLSNTDQIELTLEGSNHLLERLFVGDFLRARALITPQADGTETR